MAREKDQESFSPRFSIDNEICNGVELKAQRRWMLKMNKNRPSLHYF